MRNWKREKRFMALFLSALLLIQAPIVSAAELSGTSQLDELSAGNQTGEEQGGSQEGGPAGNQEDTVDGLTMDAPDGNQRVATGGDSTDFSKDYVVDKNGILTEYKGSRREVTIPAQVNGIPITGIEDSFFQDEIFLTKITILADIKEIGKFTFYGCKNLKEVVLPEGLERIGQTAFGSCSQLETIVLPEGLKEIGYAAFIDCTSLKSIHIPLSVTEVSMYAFDSCTALESLTFQEGEATEGRKIKTGAFQECTGLTEVEFPAGMEIEGSAFSGCSGITEYKIQEGSDYEIFDKCLYEKGRTKLVSCPSGKEEEVTFPKEITAIGDSAFDRCINLTNLEIPDTVTEIGPYAFARCSGLKKVVLPKNIDRIQNGLFKGTGITAIEIPETVTEIGFFAFQDCQGLKTFTFPGTVAYLKQYVFASCSNLESLYIQEGVEGIEQSALNECYNLKTLVIPKSVTQIEEEAIFDDGYGDGEYYEKLTIYGEAGSAAETFANQKGIKFSTGQPPQPGEEIYDISNEAFTVTLAQEVYDYDGNEKRPVVTVKKGEEELLRGTDFTVEYKDHINPGTAKAIVKGNGEYSGEVTKEFTIKGIDISSTGFTVTLSESKYTYDGKAKEPAVTVRKGEETLSGTDFTVTYENNTEPGTAKAIVTGAGIYTGTVTKEFTIEPAPKDISGSGFTVTLSETVYTYDGKEKKPAVTVAEGTKKLSGTSFTVKYENNTNPGTAKAIVTGAGAYTGTVVKEFTINPASKDTSSQEKKSLGLTCKKVFTKKYGDKAFSLQAKAVKGAKITYRSSSKKVATVDSKGKVTIKGTGIATITVKATASGYDAKTLKVAVKVSPAKASAPSLKTIKGRKLKVSWKKDKRATGYQVQYCTSKTFKKGVKAITVSKNKTVTKTIPKLAKGKRYYVRVRAYKSVKVNKKTQKLYGAWSSIKRSGKIKK